MKIIQHSKRKYWALLMEKWEQSGMTQEAFCEQQGVKLSNFTYWRKKVKEQEGVCDEGNFIEAKISNASETSQTNESLVELHFPGAIRLSIARGCSADDYQRLFAALGIVK